MKCLLSHFQSSLSFLIRCGRMKEHLSLNQMGIVTSWRCVWTFFASKNWRERSYCTSQPSKPSAVQSPSESPGQTTPKHLKQKRNQFRWQLCAIPAALTPHKKSLKYSNKQVWDTPIILTCPSHPYTQLFNGVKPARKWTWAQMLVSLSPSVSLRNGARRGWKSQSILFILLIYSSLPCLIPVSYL